MDQDRELQRLREIERRARERWELVRGLVGDATTVTAAEELWREARSAVERHVRRADRRAPERD